MGFTRSFQIWRPNKEMTAAQISITQHAAYPKILIFDDHQSKYRRNKKIDNLLFSDFS